MDPIAMHAQQFVENNPQQRPTFEKLPTPSAELSVSKPLADLATPEFITALVAKVELVKQITLTVDQRKSLVLELARIRATPRRLKEMAENVKRRCTFGTIAFEHWIADDIVTGEELLEERRRMHREHLRNLATIDAIVEQKIFGRIAEYRHELSEGRQSADKAAAELAAWRDRCASYAKARRAWYDQASMRAKQKLARVKAQLRGMDTSARLDVWQKAVLRGDVKSFDAAMVEQSHLFPDLLAGAMEEMAKEVRP